MILQTLGLLLGKSVSPRNVEKATQNLQKCLECELPVPYFPHFQTKFKHLLTLGSSGLLSLDLMPKAYLAAKQ